jgi:hypothetical protein
LIIVIAASALLGVVLGLIFRVASLIAALLAGAAASVTTGMAQGAGLWPVLLVTLAIVISLQFGYLLGVMVRFGVSSKRERTEPQEQKERSVTQRAWAEGQ